MQGRLDIRLQEAQQILELACIEPHLWSWGAYLLRQSYASKPNNIYLKHCETGGGSS